MGSSITPVFIEKDGFQASKITFVAVFEDAHVETINREQAEKYWKKAIK